jgi:hypothetical protein
LKVDRQYNSQNKKDRQWSTITYLRLYGTTKQYTEN